MQKHYYYFKREFRHHNHTLKSKYDSTNKINDMIIAYTTYYNLIYVEEKEEKKDICYRFPHLMMNQPSQLDRLTLRPRI